MKRSGKNELLNLVQSYFEDHLGRIRGASKHTIRAFKDGLRLFFIFLANSTGRSIDRLRLDDVRADAVLAFLEHVETTRGNSIRTRNCRLAAIRGFVKHLLRHDITRAAEYRRVLAIPSKRTRHQTVSYLEPEEMRVVIAQPDRRSWAGTRDHALMLLLYNTGARVSEVLGVRTHDLQMTRPFAVRLRGKGGRERLCPIWGETASALRGLLRRQPRSPEDPVFTNARGAALTRDGVAYILEKYRKTAGQTLPRLRRRRITPHVLRHSCAVALLQAGNDLTAIRDFLGHASIATTNVYVKTNMAAKTKALKEFWRRSGLETSNVRPWRPTPKLLSFLSSI